MPLLNYTTTVDAVRTASEMQGILAKAGARQIMLEYGAGGRPLGVAFSIETPHGMRQYVLPVSTVKVAQVMKAYGSGVPPRYQNDPQAERVAWRILKDWLEAQLALISTEMVSLDQVMLPYMSAGGGRTVYDLYLDQQLALPSGAAS